MDVLLQRIGRLHRHPRSDRGAFAAARAIVLRPGDRDLAPLLDAAVHGLGGKTGRRAAYQDVLAIEATLRLLERHATVSIPADNRRLVGQALHPEIRAALGAELGTRWQNHAAAIAGIGYADRGTAADLSLDLAVPFRDLTFPADAATVATRLGAADLLLDLDPPLPGPFGEAIARIRIPRWMAGDVAADDRPELLDDTGDGQRFRLGTRTYVYGRWGLIG